MTDRDYPKSARKNKETWQSWKFYETLTLEEISVLIGKRKNDLKYETDIEKIKSLKLDMAILTEAYEVIKRRK